MPPKHLKHPGLLVICRLVSKLISLTLCRFRVLSDKTVVGNLTDICQKLINLRSGVGGKIKEEELVTGSTSSLVSQLGSLCKHGDTEEEERINLKPAEVSVWCRTVINTNTC